MDEVIGSCIFSYLKYMRLCCDTVFTVGIIPYFVRFVKNCRYQNRCNEIWGMAVGPLANIVHAITLIK